MSVIKPNRFAGPRSKPVSRAIPKMGRKSGGGMMPKARPSAPARKPSKH